MTLDGGSFDGGEGMRCRRPTSVHDAVGKSYDRSMWGEGGSVGRAVDKECSDCVGMDVGVRWVVVRTPTSFGRFRLIWPRE